MASRGATAVAAGVSTTSRRGRMVDLDDTVTAGADGDDDDDASSTTSSQQQLSVRLQEMRTRVEERQRHVASILSNHGGMSMLFTKNNDSSGPSDEEEDDCGGIEVKPSGEVLKVQGHERQFSLGNGQTSVGPTPSSLFQTASTSQSHNGSSNDEDLERGGGGALAAAAEQGQEIEWPTTAFSPSPASPLAHRKSSVRRSDIHSRAAASAAVPVRMVSTTRSDNNTSAAPPGDSIVVLASVITSLDDGSRKSRGALLPHQRGPAKTGYLHMPSFNNEEQQQQGVVETLDYAHARSLTVPTSAAGHDDNHQQQCGQVGKSNRKSLVASFCCNNKHLERAMTMPDYDEHLGEGRQYWRDIILGVNDGLVSTFLLIAGVTGAHLSSTDILLTALSGTIAGAISMAAGEYMATKTQQEVMDGEIALERKHIAKNRDFELLELKEAFGIIGIPEEDNSEEVVVLRRHLMDYYAKNDEAHVKVHAVLELGVVEDEKRNPFIAGGVAFFLFFFGAMPSVIPFLCTSDIKSAFIAAAACTTTALLLVGVVKTWATRGNLWLASLENLLIAAGGGGIAYGVGVSFEKLVNG